MIVSGGLDSPYTILQGYGVGAITLVVSPSVITSLVNSTVTLTASVACTWSTDIGSLVVSGDHLSAVWTAPGVVGTGTITVTDESDPGNTVDVPAVVVAYLAGNFVLSGGAGTLVDNREPGAYSGGATAPAPAPTPVLLPDLVAGWALTAGPQQTLDSTGVIASGALDLTNNGSATFGANGVSLNGTNQWLSCSDHVTLRVNQSAWASWIEFSAVDVDPNDLGQLLLKNTTRPGPVAVASMSIAADAFGNPNEVFGGFAFNGGSLSTYFTNGDFPLNARQFIFMGYDPSAEQMFLNLNGVTLSPLGGSLTQAPPPSEISPYGDLLIGTDGSVGLWNGTIRRVRIWIGSNAVTISSTQAYLTWLYNSGSGRTDAEFAAYTG